MDNYSENFQTASHNKEELDSMFLKDSEDIDEVIFENRDLVYDLKMYFRLFRKKFSSLVREKMHKNFTNIIYLTLDCPPFTQNSLREDSPIDYINELRKQYPQNDIRVLIPIIGLGEEFRQNKKIGININGVNKYLEKTSINFDYFSQNRIYNATVYAYPKTNSNIQVYGIYSPAFSYCNNIYELSKIHYLAPFIKSCRIAIKKFAKEGFAPDIVHVENIPFFLGGEFENNFSYPIKVLQSIKDFVQADNSKIESFWGAINLADKKSMKKICKDNVIKKCVNDLFNLHNEKQNFNMKEYLKFVYKNYYGLRRYIDKGDDIEENVIFNKLNTRILQLFPQMAQSDAMYFNPIMYSIKKCDYWTTFSKTYYKNIYESENLSRKMFQLIEKTKTKSSYVSYGANLDKYKLEGTRMVYQEFNSDNFRELRGKNKTAILKELSLDRIKTNFIDPTLFRSENIKILGSLDNFYESPLFFVNPSPEIFANGIDIILNSVLKLFELHKNIQIIICINGGLNISYVKNWIGFLLENSYFKGRWVFIDGEINPAKFYAAADMTLIPRRCNSTSIEHFIAMHYGCVPITSRCGVLNDTIPDIFDDMTNGCGLKTKVGNFKEDDDVEVFLIPLMKALNLYQNNPSSWNLLIKNCLNYNSNWTFKTLEKYNKIYQDLL
ncbi:MAG: glycogen synthase [Cyanobacteria bacterium SIG28]|nr:glycogen synthase [Cyanobacteria bacterium SIG28]